MLHFKINRVNSKKHLNYVKSFPCSITKDGEHCNGIPVDPHHLMKMKGRGLALKEMDMWAVPLCRRHHREVTDYGDEEVFWAHYNMSYETVKEIAINLSNESPDPEIKKSMELWINNQRS